MSSSVEADDKGDLTIKTKGKGVTKKTRVSVHPATMPIKFSGAAASYFSQHVTKPNTTIVHVRSVTTRSASVRRAFLSGLEPQVQRWKHLIDSNYSNNPFLAQGVNIGTHRVEFTPMVRLTPLKPEGPDKKKIASCTYVDLETFMHGCQQTAALLDAEAAQVLKSESPQAAESTQ